jgi:hypothetical protein
MRIIRYLALFLILAMPGQLTAQYWGERVLEKGFEQTDFFFTPSYLSPFGIGSFKSTTPGLLRDPLLDVIVNPAYLALDSLRETYLYTDFRSARNVKERETGFYPPWYGLADARSSVYWPYPQLYLNTRRELEPVFSGAYIGRPLPSTAPEFLVGLTYQLVMQDDKYYSIPQDIYRSVVGYDYGGNRAAAAESIPIVDKYSGKDNIHQAGHFIAAFARYTLPMDLDIGVKASRVMFGRDGSFGSSNLWEYSPSSYGTSLWSNIETRDQGYAHWDLAGGLEYRLNEQTRLGAMVGHLWGDATQALRKGDSSYYSYSSNSWTSFYNRSGNTSQEWRHGGKTTYYGIDLTTRTSAAVTATFLYRHQRSTVDLGVGSAILDTSYSSYAWSDDQGPVNSYSQSYLGDSRNGGGSQTGTTDRVTASLQMEVSERATLALGAQVEWQRTETKTKEAVFATSRSAYWSTRGTYDWRYGQTESKDLFWDFATKRTSFQIPVFVTIRASDVMQVLLGLNRDMSNWKIDDVTLALFRYRESMENGTVKRDENFGERYTAPPEAVSDVRTTFLAGLTVAPSQKFQLRMLMVPNFRDTFDGSELEQIQWWLGLTLTP